MAIRFIGIPSSTAWYWSGASSAHVSSAWLNQVEIYFSIVQRKVVKPQDFADLDALEERLLNFQSRYNTTVTPFNWRFGRKSLTSLLERLADHETLAT